MKENSSTHWQKPLLYAMILIIGMFLGNYTKGRFSLQSLSNHAANPMEEIINLVQAKLH